MLIHLSDGRVQLRQKPLIHHRQFVIIQGIFRRIKVINIGVQHKERVSIPECTQEFPLSFLHRLAMEAVGQPGRGIDVEIPADRIPAVGLKGLEGIDSIPLTLAHLLAVLILDMAKYDYVLKRRFVK